MRKKIEKTCTRCTIVKYTTDFIPDSEMPDVCRECFTDDELHNYIRSDLCKAMLELNAKQKQKLIKSLVDECKKNQEELNALSTEMRALYGRKP